MIRWLIGDGVTVDYVRPWNPVIAERHLANTARMLLWAAKPARVVGNRRHEVEPVHVPGRAGAIWAQPDWERGE
jgi:hypothetical protein